MKGHRHTPEQALRKVREGEHLLNDGADPTHVLRMLEPRRLLAGGGEQPLVRAERHPCTGPSWAKRVRSCSEATSHSRAVLSAWRRTNPAGYATREHQATGRRRRCARWSCRNG
jgi:hypothetical protein